MVGRTEKVNQVRRASRKDLNTRTTIYIADTDYLRVFYRTDYGIVRRDNSISYKRDILSTRVYVTIHYRQTQYLIRLEHVEHFTIRCAPDRLKLPDCNHLENAAWYVGFYSELQILSLDMLVLGVPPIPRCT